MHEYFRFLLYTTKVLSKDHLKGTRIEHGYKRAFMSLFGQDIDTFTRTMLLNGRSIQKQQTKDEFQEDGSMTAFWVVNNQFQKFIDSKFTLGLMTVKCRTRFVHSLESKDRHKVQDDNNKSGNDINTDDAYIRPIYDEEPMAEVQLTAECNIFAIGQQHTEQPEIINEGRIDQYPKQCQVKSHMLDSSPDNQTTDYSKQSLEATLSILKETSNKAKIEKKIDVLETMNIELEHSVATLRKENETLKQHYKDLYDSIKITRSKTIEQTTSLLANNAELKAQIQEKVFAIAGLKNDLREVKRK
ncbi:hypothetical protein Tco_0653822 [Tanacetum coccineum]|uniref:Uncharacterized protein n=1 Tax=Tanacetum coccineum TaxID=301880 RepID=A0ABQ4X1H1_9ASTR